MNFKRFQYHHPSMGEILVTELLNEYDECMGWIASTDVGPAKCYFDPPTELWRINPVVSNIHPVESHQKLIDSINSFCKKHAQSLLVCQESPVATCTDEKCICSMDVLMTSGCPAQKQKRTTDKL